MGRKRPSLYGKDSVCEPPRYAHSESRVNKHLYHVSFLLIYHVVLVLHVSLLVCRDYSG